MTSTPSPYTDLFPKRGDITGLSNQAFGEVKSVISYVLGGIKANTALAAIGIIAPGTTIVQYLFAPKIHYNLGGVPNKIIGSEPTSWESLAAWPCHSL